MLELARSADWEAVNQLSLHVHKMHVTWRPDIFCDSNTPYSQEKFLQDVSDRMVYVAKIDGDLVGYVTLSKRIKSGAGIVEKTQLVLDAICVDEGHRGQGIGRSMVADVRALAKAFRCQEVILGVQPENDGAVAFYQKCGFVIRTINMDMKV